MKTPLSIAFDALLWDEPTTGIGLVTRQWAHALEQEGVQVVKMGAAHSGEFPRRALGKTGFTLARLPALLRQTDVLGYHALGNFNLPLWKVPGKKYVLTVHDLIPQLLPETVSTAFRLQFKMWLHRSLQVAEAVTCVSETTRRDLLSYYSVSPDKVWVVPNGVDHTPPPDAQATAQVEALALPENYVLYAGSLDVRKNVTLLLSAMERLAQKGHKVPLVLMGQKWFGSGEAEQRIQALRAGGLDVRHLGYQPDNVFYEVVRRAAVFAFPSWYEGFGLPPLEAMSLGVCTLVSHGGSLPEVCGPGAWVLPLNDTAAWAQAIFECRQSDSLRAQWAEKGKRHAAAYTWSASARKLKMLYEQL